MSTSSSHSPRLPAARTSQSHARAHLSPLLRRATQQAVLRSRIGAPARTGNKRQIWAANTMTPPTPALVDRWWNPHLLDRLQTPLSRIRE